MASLLGILARQCILIDGPMETRMIYDHGFDLGDDFSIAQFVFDRETAAVLRSLYEGDLEVARQYQQPIFLTIPTFRASLSHLENYGFKTDQAVREVNEANYHFVNEIRQRYLEQVTFLMGPVGPKCDAYSPDSALSVEEAYAYHQLQIQVLADLGVDLISIVTIPSLTEIKGAAMATSDTGKLYSVGFVLNEAGTLLDGTPIEVLIEEIDSSVKHKPLCYLIVCTHASVVAKALEKGHPNFVRIKGLKANGSCLPLDVLAASDKALADPPAEFAEAVVTLAKQYGWQVMGGCCGTGREHLAAIARCLNV